MFQELQEKLKRIERIEPLRVWGRVHRAVGLTIESEGPLAAVGQILYLEESNLRVPLQVVGFNGNSVYSMPLGQLTGIQPGIRLYNSGHYLQVVVSNELLGRVINALGQPIDGGDPLLKGELVNIYHQAPNAMQRLPIKQPLITGIKAIDGLITIGQGQRMGIFSGSGVGKSTLLGMIARNTYADINVIALVGERGRELQDFIQNSLQEEGVQRSVVVVTTADEPPLLKIAAAFTATAIAEYFCRQGANVLLMMDSITRLAMAQREVGLSVGEPPSAKGYTPSVFTMMPRLLERAGNFQGQGSITGIYTVLVEGDDVTEPISDHARSILDGHIVLSRALAQKNFYPAIDVLGSVSRLMNEVVDRELISIAGEIRELLAVFREAEDLINIGAYISGANPKIDRALQKIEKINSFLCQRIDQKVSFEETLQELSAILK